MIKVQKSRPPVAPETEGWHRSSLQRQESVSGERLPLVCGRPPPPWLRARGGWPAHCVTGDSPQPCTPTRSRPSEARASTLPWRYQVGGAANSQIPDTPAPVEDPPPERDRAPVDPHSQHRSAEECKESFLFVAAALTRRLGHRDSRLRAAKGFAHKLDARLSQTRHCAHSNLD